MVGSSLGTGAGEGSWDTVGAGEAEGAMEGAEVGFLNSPPKNGGCVGGGVGGLVGATVGFADGLGLTVGTRVVS